MVSHEGAARLTGPRPRPGNALFLLGFRNGSVVAILREQHA